MAVTFAGKGGLYHIVYLFLFFFASMLLIFLSLDLIYENVSVKPLLLNAFSYISFALLNMFSSQEMINWKTMKIIYSQATLEFCKLCLMEKLYILNALADERCHSK